MTRARERLDPGIEGPAASVSPSVAGLEQLEELGRETHRPPGRGLPAAELTRGIIPAEDRGQAIDLAEHPALRGLGRCEVVGQHSQLQRGAHHVFMEEREVVRGGHGPRCRAGRASP